MILLLCGIKLDETYFSLIEIGHRIRNFLGASFWLVYGIKQNNDEMIWAILIFYMECYLIKFSVFNKLFVLYVPQFLLLVQVSQV